MRWPILLIAAIGLFPMGGADSAQTDPAGDQKVQLWNGAGHPASGACQDASTDVVADQVYVLAGSLHLSIDVVDAYAALQCAGAEGIRTDRAIEQLTSRRDLSEGGPNISVRARANALAGDGWLLCIDLRLEYVWYEEGCYGENRLADARFEWSIPISGEIQTSDGPRHYDIAPGYYRTFARSSTHLASDLLTLSDEAPARVFEL